jgi:DNA transformation protein
MAEPIANLKNLGPKSSQWLADSGIKTIEDLRRIGSVEAFHRVTENGFNTSLNLLYALDAGLRGIHWRELPPPIKEKLKRDASRA